MALHILTWNLNKEGSNYSHKRTEFLRVLDEYDHAREADLDTVAFLNSTSSDDQIRKHFQSVLDKNDTIFISTFDSDKRSGWLASNVIDWIESRQIIG
jgi:hypothetical protein